MASARSLLIAFLLLIGVQLLPVVGATADTGNSVRSHPFPTLTGTVRRDLLSTSVALRDDGSKDLQRKRYAGHKAPAQLDAIVLMCDFADSLMLGRYGQVPGDFPAPQQSEFYYDAHDSLYFHHLFLDVADYYDAVSGGTFTLNFTVHGRIQNLAHPMAFYGNHPEEGEQPILLSRDVVAAFDDEIDFSLYDTVILIHAGAGGETDINDDSPEQVYSTYLDPADFARAQEDSLLETPYLATNDHVAGEGVDQVLILPETEFQDPVPPSFDGYFGSLGVYCFEVGLRLGMLSLSDFTPSGNVDSQGIGEFGLMGYGLFVAGGWLPPQPCAFNKMLMGWLNPIRVNADDNTAHLLTPCEDSSAPEAALRVDATGQEYWLLAYRLQDPDGNRIFSFADSLSGGDLNGNNTPDFWDADSQFGGVPVGRFDPTEDIKERLFDAEWDFYMSENSARAAEEKGAGSGLYIWHIDEGVIQEVFDLPVNLFNADSDHKAVDLEEADGIQDLDSRQPSAFMLGGDDDSFRAEGTSRFGPETRPSTVTNGGAWTGVVFSDISKVVHDSTAFTWYNAYSNPPAWITGFDYADTLTLNISRQLSPQETPDLGARMALPVGMDPRGSHLLAVDLDGANGAQEILLAGQAGEVYAFERDLTEYQDHDGDPTTVAPLATGTLAGSPVAWNLPAAVGDIDGDGGLEIVLTGPGGIWAFHDDGTPVRTFDPTSHGLYLAMTNIVQPPVLVAAAGEAEGFDPDTSCDVCVLVADGDACRLVVVGGPDADERFDLDLGMGRAAGPAVGTRSELYVVLADTLAGNPRLMAVDLVGSGGEPLLSSFALPFQPGPFPPFRGHVGEDENYVLVTGGEGQVATIFPDAEVVRNWDERVTVSGPWSAGHAFNGSDVNGRVSRDGEWLTGWPWRPQTASAVAPVTTAAGVLVTSGADARYLFTADDGRIQALDATGVAVPGYPLAGPAAAAGTPVLVGTDEADTYDLAALGTFASIVGLDGTGSDLVTETRAELVIWRDVSQAAPAAWAMWGANPWRNGMTDFSHVATSQTIGSGLVPGSHICYPNPLTDGPLYVRGNCGAAGRARAVIYNLEGEQVAEADWQAYAGGEPFALTVDLATAASGLYLCRLQVETDAGEAETSVIHFAVVH